MRAHYARDHSTPVQPHLPTSRIPKTVHPPDTPATPLSLRALPGHAHRGLAADGGAREHRIFCVFRLLPLRKGL